MSGEQIAILLLLVGSFLAGWLARGDSPGEANRRSPEPASPDELLAEAGVLLERAVPLACAAARGAPEEAAGGAVLESTLDALDRIDERLDPLPGFLLYEALDRALNELAFLRRAFAGRKPPPADQRRAVEASVAALTAAHARYRRARSAASSTGEGPARMF